MKVKMKFSEEKFYNDQTKPMFEAGKVYELEGFDWIQRWLKRGGEIVEELKVKPVPVQEAPKEIEQDLEHLADEEEKLEDDSKEESKSQKKQINKKSSGRK